MISLPKKYGPSNKMGCCADLNWKQHKRLALQVGKRDIHRATVIVAITVGRRVARGIEMSVLPVRREIGENICCYAAAIARPSLKASKSVIMLAQSNTATENTVPPMNSFPSVLTVVLPTGVPPKSLACR